MRRLGVRVGALVGRLVAHELLQARLARVSFASNREPPVRWSMPAELMPGGHPVTTRELLRRLRTDRGCVGVPPRRHLACRAALDLAGREPEEPAVLGALEETVTAAARPACVRSAGVTGLARVGTAEAHRALRRMHQVTRRRSEWEGRASDRALAAEIDTVLGAR